MVIHIKKISGKWLVNGKQYPELTGEEKTFFDEFLISMKLMKGVEDEFINKNIEQC